MVSAAIDRHELLGSSAAAMQPKMGWATRVFCVGWLRQTGVSKKGGTPKWRVHIREKIPLKWMIWGYPYFKKPPNGFGRNCGEKTTLGFHRLPHDIGNSWTKNSWWWFHQSRSDRMFTCSAAPNLPRMAPERLTQPFVWVLIHPLVAWCQIQPRIDHSSALWTKLE